MKNKAVKIRDSTEKLVKVQEGYGGVFESAPSDIQGISANLDSLIMLK
jgi:hypothetical protein